MLNKETLCSERWSKLGGGKLVGVGIIGSSSELR